ncbi:MAG: zinc ribbon domain-containing protein [Prevotella sp.]|nr:zinc ribbon domain-containing protein [Prevotella sp.]
MALIKCPECGNNVSDSASNCPLCGYPVKKKTDKTIKIKIEAYPLGSSYGVTIIDGTTKKQLRYINSGEVGSFESNSAIRIEFVGLSKSMPMYSAYVEPGKRYVASWGAGLIMPKIVSCREVDYIE